MSYDGLFAGVTARQLNRLLTGAKIEKIYQPEPDEILMQVYTKDGRKKLLLSTQPSSAAVYLTERAFENPPSAPSFCMLLRKHLQSGRITEVSQPGTERVIEFLIETVNEMGYAVNKRLVAETMGKHSNLILIDRESGKIIDSIKRISIDVNRYRQLLPGLPYTAPPSQDKLDFWTAGRDEISLRLSQQSLAGPQSVMAGIQGFSPVAAEEIWLAGPREELPDRIQGLRETLQQESSLFPAVYLGEEGTPQDVHIIPLIHIFRKDRMLRFETPGQALDYFFQNRTQSNRVAQRSVELHRQVQALLDKLLLKKQRLLEDLREAGQADQLRLQAELLTAGIHKARPGDDRVTVDNYYDGSTLTIPLDPRLTAAKNAQNYYKKYGKAKTAGKEKLLQLEETEKDLEYMESVLSAVTLAREYETLEQIRRELSDAGYLRIRKAVRQKPQKTKPYRYRTAGGMELLAGRSNTENDHVTFTLAAKTDLWFHAKDIPGSHVVLLCRERRPEQEDILEAAALAAYYSKASASENVPVDYTQVRHVRKPSGARPGMVVYAAQKTLFVDPKLPIVN